MDFFVENKWIILICLEVLAWAATFFMLYARYGMKSQLWFRVGVVIFTLTGIIPQIILGIINFIWTRQLDLFTLAIVLLILYGVTIGRKDVKKMDAWAKSKFSKKKAT